MASTSFESEIFIFFDHRAKSLVLKISITSLTLEEVYHLVVHLANGFLGVGIDLLVRVALVHILRILRNFWKIKALPS
jgi:hypothetical protein